MIKRPRNILSKAAPRFLVVLGIPTVFLLLCCSNRLDTNTLGTPEALGAARNSVKYGFYSAVPMKGSREEQIARMQDLQAMGVDTVIEAREFKLGENFKAYVRDLHAHGIKLVGMVTKSEDWYGPGGKGDYDSSKAERKLKEASPFANFFDYLYLAHEVNEFASHEERVRMYKLAKQYFPNIPILMYYGGAIDRMEQDLNRRRRGRLIKEYQYGPGEADIALISVAKGSGGKIDPQSALKRLDLVVKIIKRNSPSAEVWVQTSFDKDDIMRSDKSSMWSPDDIQRYGTALLQSGKLDGFFLRGYGRFTYDLGYPDWKEQRAAFASLSKLKN